MVRVQERLENTSFGGKEKGPVFTEETYRDLLPKNLQKHQLLIFKGADLVRTMSQILG